MAELLIRQADAYDHEAIIALWHACFEEDPEDYAQRFLSALPHDSIALIGEADNSLVTMLFLIPSRARIRDQVYTVRYLYAGCTHPNHRNNGYYRLLMTAAAQLVKELGESAIFLHPADSSLYSTYCRLGYLGGINGGSRRQLPDGMSPCRDIDEYCRMRQSLLNTESKNRVVWEISSDLMHFFLTDAVSHHALLLTSPNAAALVTDHTVIELICDEKADISNDYCLWLPVGNTQLINDMNAYGGFTGIIGE